MTHHLSIKKQYYMDYYYKIQNIALELTYKGIIEVIDVFIIYYFLRIYIARHVTEMFWSHLHFI